jgi:two-component system nitrate/nitrite response regulator NarL
VSKIGLLLHSQLVKEALSPPLVEAGFTVFHEPDHGDKDTIVVIDFENCKDPESVQGYQSRDVKIVALTSKADSQEIGLDEVARLSGVLTYDLSVADFVRALLLICSGERVFPRDLGMGSGQTPSVGTELRSNGVPLSPREKEILSYLVAGYSNKLIARELGITEATVKVHLKSVQRKIRVENRTQAAIWALSNLPELDTSPRGFV